MTITLIELGFLQQFHRPGDAAIAFGHEFEFKEDGCPNISFWVACEIKEGSAVGDTIGYGAADPALCGTISGGDTLINGGNYTLTISNLTYEIGQAGNNYYVPQASWYCIE